MILGDILCGKEKSHLVVVHDNISQNGRPLLYCFVKSLLQSADVLHAVLWDVAPKQFINSFDPILRQRIHCYDGFKDPLGWDLAREECCDQAVTIHRNSDLAQIVKNTVKNYCSKSKTDDVVKVAVVVDSISKLLLWQSPSAVCTFLHQLFSSSAGTGYQVVQVACLVHCDLHDDHTLKAVNFLASSIVSLSQSENSDEAVTWCKILHKRKTGKVIRKLESLSIGDDHKLTEHEERDWNVSSSDIHSTEPTKEADPTKDLTFNLKLTDDEKQARSNLKLPYMFHEEKTSEVTINRPGEGRVFYQPDEADDFDEEDPDDDLDI